MEIIILICVIFILFTVYNLKSSFEDKIHVLIKKIEQLQTQISTLDQTSIITNKKTEVKVSVNKEVNKIIKPEIYEVETSPTIKANIAPEPILNNSDKKEEVKSTPKQKIEEEKKVEVKRPKKPSFFERNPDLEKFIGENLINKIGIGILVLGIGFFVKYAISKDWINEIGRTSIGIFCGAILITLAHKLRKTFSAFSSVLVGGGLAILYFTISIAYHEYHVFNQIVAFIIMIVITAFSVLLSISYDRKELAILALIGGFTSPFLLSSGTGNYISLFTYITILNTGILVLAYFKKWNILNILTYIFTIILFSGWLFKDVIWAYNPPYIGAFIFASIFYVLFFLMNIVNNIKENRKFNTVEISILMSNTFIYFSAGLFILEHLNQGKYNGVFCLLIATFNLSFTYFLFKKENIDKTLFYLLIGIVLTFVSLTAPIQLEGNYITLFWAAEAVLLLWIYQKSNIKLMQKSSIIIMFLMVVSLLLDWEKIYFSNAFHPMYIIFNKGFITGLFAILSIFLKNKLLKNEKSDFLINYKLALKITFVLFIYLVGFFELRHQLHSYIHYYAVIDIILGIYNFTALILLNLAARKYKSIPFFLEVSVILGLIGILSYPLFYHEMAKISRNAYILTSKVSLSNFMMHYFDIILILILLYTTFKNIILKEFKIKEINQYIMWFISIIIIFISSTELDHLIVLNSITPSSGFSIYHIELQSHKIGYPILWGVYSFVLMFVGMKVKNRDLRIISLSLFLIIILKLFIFDIRGVSEGGKIAAFIFLGVILLVVSFMYQKLKKLVLDNDSKTKIGDE